MTYYNYTTESILVKAIIALNIFSTSFIPPISSSNENTMNDSDLEYAKPLMDDEDL